MSRHPRPHPLAGLPDPLMAVIPAGITAGSVPAKSVPAGGGAAGVVAEAPCCPPLARTSLTVDAAGLLAPAFKALGDPVRLRLMSMIASAPGGEACVCDLTPAFDLSGPTISHHLKTLRNVGLVAADRRGTWVYYRARTGLLRQLATLLAVDDPPPTR